MSLLAQEQYGFLLLTLTGEHVTAHAAPFMCLNCAAWGTWWDQTGFCHWCPSCNQATHPSREQGIPQWGLKAFFGFLLSFSILNFLIWSCEHTTFSTDLLSVCKSKLLNWNCWRNLKPLCRWGFSKAMLLKGNANNLERYFFKNG